MRKLVCIAIVVLAAVFSSHAQRVKINFTPESETFSAATKEYQAIWKSEGDKIIKTLEKVSGLKFRESEFETIVFEGISHSCYPGGPPMKMRASYSADTKKATLIRHRTNFSERVSSVLIARLFVARRKKVSFRAGGPS